jgi:hypothetical protein
MTERPEEPVALRRAGRTADSRRACRVRALPASRGREAPAAERRCRRRLRARTSATAVWGSAPARARHRPERPPAPRERPVRQRRTTSHLHLRQPAAPASATTRRWRPGQERGPERLRSTTPHSPHQPNPERPEQERSTTPRSRRAAEPRSVWPAGCSTSRRRRSCPTIRPQERRRARLPPEFPTTCPLLQAAVPPASRCPKWPRAEVEAAGGSKDRRRVASPVPRRWHPRQAAEAVARSASRLRWPGLRCSALRGSPPS